MRGNIHDLHYLAVAREKAADSDCLRRQVGAVIVKHGSLIIAAANGTPTGCIPCNRSGCPRCQSDILSGQAYDSCICIHAEQRAIALAASSGASTAGAKMYVTLRPCLPCLNLCFHAGAAKTLHFLNPGLFIIVDSYAAKAFQMAHSVNPGYSSRKYLQRMECAQSDIRNYGEPRFQELEPGTAMTRIYDKLTFMTGKAHA